MPRPNFRRVGLTRWKTGAPCLNTGRNYHEIAAVKVGDFLSKRLCVESKEEALIKEFWEVATPDERKTLGKLLFKIMDKG
jgi:hypothetical protein